MTDRADEVSRPVPGSVVYLKSGSPPLLVESVDGDNITVVWVDRQGARQSHVLAAVCVRRGRNRDLN